MKFLKALEVDVKKYVENIYDNNKSMAMLPMDDENIKMEEKRFSNNVIRIYNNNLVVDESYES